MQTPLNEEQLDLMLSEPSEQLVRYVRELEGDITLLGANGKIGLSLSHMAQRAIEKAGVKKQVYAVSRFSDREGKEQLESWGVKTIACDLLEAAQVARLPVTKNVIFLAGRKFGTTGNEPLTWAMNALAPAHCAAHYKDSRIVVFSTGCVYPAVSASTGGSVESDKVEPIGEYAQSCLCRERIFEYFSLINGTPVLLYRLNYATDLRYGVLYDICSKIRKGEPVVTGMEHFNIIWQGDANNAALLSLQLAASPANILNVTGEDILSVETVAREMGEIMHRPVQVVLKNRDHSFLNNASNCFRLFGKPALSSGALIRMQAEWVENGGRTLNKPTRFETDNGNY
ncbi:MAG: NAD(P)-dependent oxidoreductase [Tannerellaceae bacterium]|jgi:dTDP-4-dehydrorhamnose reductase|nr:NAD(P)-dependent oxidoreductase [Tannerellaceae bacterium]